MRQFVAALSLAVALTGSVPATAGLAASCAESLPIVSPNNPLAYGSAIVPCLGVELDEGVPADYVSPISPEYSGRASSGGSPIESTAPGDPWVFEAFGRSQFSDGQGGTYYYGGYGDNPLTAGEAPE